ncbi:MAG: hypothetical protein ABI142_08920, partial [Bryocella sp.]
MDKHLESAEAIGAVDDILAGAGILPGRRATRKGSWKAGERVRAARGSASLLKGRKGRPGVVKAEILHNCDRILHGFSTRENGVSVVYRADDSHPGELNLGWTATDP